MRFGIRELEKKALIARVVLKNIHTEIMRLGLIYAMDWRTSRGKVRHHLSSINQNYLLMWDGRFELQRALITLEKRQHDLGSGARSEATGLRDGHGPGEGARCLQSDGSHGSP